MSTIEKIDSGLQRALHAFEENAGAPPDDGISVTLRFDGDLAAIEALGYETSSVHGDQASGIIRFRDVAAIAAHPSVLSISAGSERKLDLEQAVPDIHVRSLTKDGVKYTDGEGLWHVTKTGTDWKALPDGTGKGVIVAILDSGIDYTHPMFMKTLTPKKTTRILRIWDQGLKPASESECPDASLLEGPGKRYGVEYKDAAINDVLQAKAGAKPILHKDCNGHGTHVAGIAAGGQLFPTGGDAARVGVAPEADIIVVKLMDLPDDEIRYRIGTTDGAQVGAEQRFKDAMLYCLRIARNMQPPRPIVVNISLGAVSHPGDGLDDYAVWLDGVLDPAGPDDKTNHFPSGAIVVKSAGNEGDVADRATAKITVPASTTVILPLQLVDKRGGAFTSWKNCARRPHNTTLDIHFWYRPDADLVKFAFRLPGQAVGTFSTDVGATQKKEQGFTLVAGPPASVTLEPTKFDSTVHRITLKNHSGNNPPVAHPAGGTVTRHHVQLTLQAKELAGGALSYAEGYYEVRIKAPKDTEIYVMCDGGAWGGTYAGFEIQDEYDDDPLKPIDKTVIDRTNRCSAVDTLGRHVITVASYRVGGHRIGDSSSRGPLRDFSSPAKGTISDKPDLAAPGVNIWSADTVHREAPPTTPDWVNGVRFVPKTGTSMAAPFVTGVVALLLDKKPGLKVSEVRTELTDAAHFRPGNGPLLSNPEYQWAFGQGMLFGLKSHLFIQVP